MRKYLVKLLSKYPDLCLDALGEDKEELLTLAVAKHFNTISSDDILKFEKGKWMFEGKVLDLKMYELLAAEARNFMKGKLWKVLQADIKWHANKALFIDSKDTLDMIIGKSWLYVLDGINTRLKKMV